MLNKILIAILSFILVFVGITTIAVKNRPPQKTIVTAQGYSEAENTVYSAYRKIGKIRTSTAGDQKNKRGTIIIIQPYFSYPAEDTEFYEELARKNPEIKSIIINYFKAYTKNQLTAMGEITIKNDLLQKINEQLVLNKIQNIYFSEFTYLE